jgi:hypothetical protein
MIDGITMTHTRGAANSPDTAATRGLQEALAIRGDTHDLGIQVGHT